MQNFNHRRSLLVIAGALAAVTVLVSTSVVSAKGASVVRATGDLITYANPYANGTPNPLDGGEASVHAVATASGKTIVTLHVSGLPANRSFGSHVHILACDDNKAGGHYRNVPADPASPENEIWLDFTTNAAGRGEAHATVDWVIRSGGAKAVIIHDRTSDSAGVAGPKLGCLNVDF